MCKRFHSPIWPHKKKKKIVVALNVSFYMCDYCDDGVTRDSIGRTFGEKYYTGHCIPLLTERWR